MLKDRLDLFRNTQYSRINSSKEILEFIHENRSKTM